MARRHQLTSESIMRIVSVNNTADLYGASRCLERLAARLIAGGHDVLVVVPSTGPLKEALERSGVTVLLHPLLSIVDRNTTRTWRDRITLLLTFPLSVAWLALVILRFRADLVHSNSGVVLSPAFAARLAGRPHVWHVREFFLEFPRLWRHYERLMYRLSAAIIAISQSVRRQFSPEVRSRVSVVYDGLPREDFARAALVGETHALRHHFGLDGRPSACVVGRLKWTRKGQEVLIRAAGRLKAKYPTARYLVVGTAAPGSESHLQRFRALAAEHGVTDNIVFTGDLQDPRPVYAAVDVSVVPSVDPEPFGCVVIESMALETPVVGSAAAGIAEQIVHGETGLLFPPGDDRSLAASLDQLFADAATRSRMANRGRQHYLGRFEMEHSYGEHIKVFDAVRRRTPVRHDGAEEAAAR
jgi:glycosyltransferase involved in cell wall biosynthesis